MTPPPSTLADLPHLLKLGLGRAIPLVRQHYDPGCRNVILHACTHLLAFDGQVEGTRSEYMFEVVEATGDVEFYRVAILDAARQLDETMRDYDIQQTLLMALQFADRGDAEARQVIVERFLATPELGSYAVADALIMLDGVDGFLFVAEQLSERFCLLGREAPFGIMTYEPDIHLFFRLQDAVGSEQIESFWEQLKVEHPQLKPFFDQIDHWRRPRKGRSKRQPEPQLSYAEFRQQLQKHEREPLFNQCRVWGRGASDDELRLAAEDFLAETDPAQLRRYLGIFQNRSFPLDLSKIMSLASGSTEFIASDAIDGLDAFNESQRPPLWLAALNALKIIRSPRVRAFALDCIERGYLIGLMTGLLVNNDQPGDWALVEPLTRLPLDDEDLHSLGWSLIDLFDAQQIGEAVPALMNLYERNPCSVCRERIVARLHWLGALPEWMRAECLLDCYDSLRANAASDFADVHRDD